MPSIKRCLELRSAILCDDIRREDSGKSILIGVYPSNIGVRKIPIDLKLSLYIEFKPVCPGTANLKIRFLNSCEKKPRDINFSFTVDDDFSIYDGYVAALTGIPVKITGEGTLDIKYKYENSSWKIIGQHMFVTPSNSDES